MTDASEWQGRVGTAWAQEWRRTDRSFGALTAALVDPAALPEFAHALDIGCGAGEVSLALARARPAARVTGIDISDELIAVADERAATVDNLDVTLADAARWRHDGTPPDLLISRHGVMFFPDPVAAFTHLRGEGAAGATLRFSCFRSVAENAWARELAAILPAAPDGAAPPPPDPNAPGPFAFGSPDRVRAILADAGWVDAAFQPVDYAMIAGEGAGAIDDALAYFQRIGPAARTLAALDEDARPAAVARLRALLERHFDGAEVALPAACWIVTARSP